MVKNYATVFLSVLMIILAALNPMLGIAQEPKVFKISDFDLKGNVKSCLVITSYGKEEYNFDTAGFLTKSITRYNHSDYGITRYKYNSENELLEKRTENYRDETIDKQTSLVHVYKIDTTKNKMITEKIISYNNEFLGQYEYTFNSEENITDIKKTDNNGIDETIINYTKYKGETTVEYLLNGVIKKSVRTSMKKSLGKKEDKIILIKKFLYGEPYEATEAIFDSTDKLKSKIFYLKTPDAKGFEEDRTKTYFYNEKGMLTKIETKRDQAKSEEEFIYQFDEKDNWIKEIITPENTYKTRKIMYYETATLEER